MSEPLHDSTTFGDNAREALQDVKLRRALRQATDLFADRRREAIAPVPEWQLLRVQARAIKDETLLHLDRYLEQFTANAERAGARVHWARDGQEACALIVELARARGVRTAVKSKSMASEEIHLNAALAAAGIEPIETDLGEYIIQLAGETPSHIIVPAIHKSRGQIGELFAERLGIPLSDDPATLTAAARRVLRRHFAEADLGISGVNFGIAETGSIHIVENEGNARLSMSLPRTHIALMGIEKVIPRLSDLNVFLQLLPRSGTGQQLTTYNSLLTGVQPDEEGPAELHIVLLDNGRSRMLAHPVTRQSLACIRCGACLNACPVYQQIGGHAYGSVYPGPIGAVITPQLFGIPRAAQLPFASTLCGACRDVCPVGIDIPRLLLHLRAQVVDHASKPRPASERMAFRAFAGLARHPALFGLVTGLGRLAQRVLRVGPVMRGGRGLAGRHGPLGAWTATRDLRALAPRSFREQWSGLKQPDQPRRESGQ